MKNLLLLFFLLIAQPAWGAYAVVSNVAAGSTDGNDFTTGTLDSTGANLIVLVLSAYDGSGGATYTITDAATGCGSPCNTWTHLTLNQNASNTTVRISYVKNPTVGTNHTFTVSSSYTAYPSLCVATFSGANITAPADGDLGTAHTDADTSLATGAIVPAENSELVITGASFSAGESTFAIDWGSGSDPGSIINTVDPVAGQHNGCGLAYKIQTGAASVNPTWSWTGSFPASANIASFKALIKRGVMAINFQ